MYLPTVLSFAVLITSVVANANHAQRRVPVLELASSTNSTNSTLENKFSALDISHAALPAPQSAWDEDFPHVPADDPTWDRAVCKGTKMMAQMSYSDRDVAQLLPVPKETVQSPWSFVDLKKWGYGMFESVGDYTDFGVDKYWGISPYLQSIQVTDQFGHDDERLWQALCILHYDPTHGENPTWQQYTDPYGKKRRVTDAKFYMAILSGFGIMTQNRMSPWESLKQLHPDDADPAELPELQRSSDMMWAMWEYAVRSVNRHKIKAFFTLAIENEITITIISRALQEVHQDLTPAGYKFSTSTPQGKALLSSPNAAGFAHFLIERKAQVGLKSIESIIVMECQNLALSPCMVLNVVDLAGPTPRPKDDTTPTDPSGVNPNEPYPTNPSQHSDVHVENKREVEEAPPLGNRSFVRTHTFSLAEDGNLTLSSLWH